MLRLACCLATERGVSVVAPIDDALMVEGPADAIDEIVARSQEVMAEASAVIPCGFRLRSDVVIGRWPDRYMDGRGREFWGRVSESLASSTDRTPIPGTRLTNH
jgi:DNA polymerase I